MSSETLVPVEGVPCPCQGTPHPAGDTIYLHPKIGFRGGALAEEQALAALAIGTGDKANLVQAALVETFVLYGVADWTLTNGDGQSKIPVSYEAIADHLLTDYSAALPVAEKASELYKEAILGPLRVRLSKLSARGRKTESTSPRTGSSAKRGPRPGPSSTSTTATEPPTG